jgi:hypothetical protein
MNSTQEIERCPFCGAEADVQDDFGVEYWVQCSDLGCGSTDGTVHANPNDAIKHWNRRSQSQEAQPSSSERALLVGITDDDGHAWAYNREGGKFESGIKLYAFRAIDVESPELEALLKLDYANRAHAEVIGAELLKLEQQKGE